MASPCAFHLAIPGHCWNNIVSIYLMVSLGKWSSQAFTFLLVPSYGQKCQHVIASCRYTKISSVKIHLSLYECLLFYVQRYNYFTPAFDICFVVTAILERKALHCSTSSPSVLPAPSWFAPLHFTWTERHKHKHQWYLVQQIQAS